MANLTDNQKSIAKTMDIANQLVIDYAAPEVPALDNATPQKLTEEFGRLNEARKALEKTEKIVRGRLDALLEGKKECRSDNFQYKIESTERTALNQGKAKEYLSEQGVLEDYMSTSEVERRTVKRI